MALKHQIQNSGTWKYILFCLAYLIIPLSMQAERIRENPWNIFAFTITPIILSLLYAVGASSARAGNRTPLVAALIFGLPISFLAPMVTYGPVPRGNDWAIVIIGYFVFLPFSVVLGLLFSLWSKNDDF